MNQFLIMNFISTKNLRASLPLVRKRLAQGEEFLLIHQSKPIAKIIPVNDSGQESKQAILEDFQRATIEDVWDDDYLTKEEVDYYLSLSEYEAR